MGQFKKNLIISLQVIVVILGMMRFVGDTLRIKMLDEIGFGSGFSPLPLVFSDRAGIEDFAHVMKIETLNENGVGKTSYFDQKFYSNIEGPLSLVGAYSVAIAYSPRFPEMLWRPALEYGFCNNGTLAKTLNEPVKIKSVVITISHLEKSHLNWRQTLNCAI